MARINNTNIEKTSLVDFRDGAFELDVAVSATDNTVWLTLDQVSLLFEKDKSTVSRHIKNIFSEHELEKEATVAKYATVQLEGSRSVERLIEYYNLDVIISVGYRVKSKRGIAFRKWATTVLNDYLLRGYAENKRRLEAQGKTIELQSRIIAHMAEVDEEELMSVINRYTEALDLLDDYDHQCLKRTECCLPQQAGDYQWSSSCYNADDCRIKTGRERCYDHIGYESSIKKLVFEKFGI